jgi:predicted phage baseplate assembly protein
MDDVVPAVTLTETSGDARRDWNPQRDLLASGAFAFEFVAEVEEGGLATIRFGDDVNGARPAPGSSCAAAYRVGNGVRGNVGADSIDHLITAVAEVVGVRNPLPGRRGAEPETNERVRQTAPAAFRVQQRAVTPEDYAEVAQRHPEVQRAVATLRWTGSWRTVYLSVDRLGGRPVDADFIEALRAHLERFRMAGHDLEIQGPRCVALEVWIRVCVLPDYFRSDVKQALLEVFSSVETRDGQRGVFHPDKFTFAQPVYLSHIYAAAQAVPGVGFVRVERFGRLGEADPGPLERGVLDLGRLEIAQLDNDPNFPERGSLRLIMDGGR